MANRFLLLCFLLIPGVLAAQVISIDSARVLPPGTTVTVRGIATNGGELGIIRYFQDGTGGIAAYPGTGSVGGFAAAVMPGDSIEVTGILDDYHGLLEINPVTGFSKILSGVPLPAPKLLKLSDISEEYESQLVGFECVVFPSGGGIFSAGAFDVTDSDGNSAKLYLQSGHPMAGAVIPGTPIYLRSILSQYNSFQLLVRNQDDFSQSLCFYFTEQLQQSGISTTGFTLSWETNLGAVTKLHYGTTPALGAMVSVAGDTTANAYVFNNLQPGTVYWVQVESERNGSVILSPAMPFATQSLSSGQIKVFFNHDIEPAFANGFMPEGQSSAEVLTETMARINAAQQTLDVAMYNNNRPELVNALSEAYNRGVRVRYIADGDASNTALNTAVPFPVVRNNSSGLMHDKFLVIDADLPDKSWVMSGSLNWTTQNIFTDFNNTLFIQDQSLARAYEIEFEEMWGSNDTIPDLQNGRFGSNKRDNTPHHFIIGGKQLESWFSPSDRTTSRIVETVYTTDGEALFATFSFTKDEVADALVDVFNNNAAVRGIIENISDLGAEIDYLKAAGIDCRPHPLTGEFHHKYGVFDTNSSDPVVLTGSHNWSNAAETSNDENTLVIHDFRLASLYKAEFEKRWQALSVPSYAPPKPHINLFPNPASEFLNIQMATETVAEIMIRNLLGELVLSATYDGQSPEHTVDISTLAVGQYIAFIKTRHEFYAIPFQKI